MADPPGAPGKLNALCHSGAQGQMKNALYPFLLLKQEGSLVVFTGRVGSGKAIQLNKRQDTRGSLKGGSMAEMLHPNTIPSPPGGCREAVSCPRFTAPSIASIG